MNLSTITSGSMDDMIILHIMKLYNFHAASYAQRHLHYTIAAVGSSGKTSMLRTMFQARTSEKSERSHQKDNLINIRCETLKSLPCLVAQRLMLLGQ